MPQVALTYLRRLSRPPLVLVLVLGALTGGCGDAASPAASPDAATSTDGGGRADASDVGASPCEGAGFMQACDDGNPCTEKDRCIEGTCVGELSSCDDHDPCTDDRCDVTAGGCVHEANDEPCDDGNPCSGPDTCTAGGGCAGAPRSDLACDDGDVCTTGDTCHDGHCAGALNVCNDLNPCTEDFCDAKHEAAIEGTGCVHLPLDHGCDDLNTCTLDDTCVEGVCVGTVDEGAACTDGNLCTDDDTCQADGSCVGQVATDCTDGNPCTIDTCAPTGCLHTPDVDAPCDDGVPCTVSDRCRASGACLGDPTPCQPADQCIVGWCDPPTGTCLEEPQDCDDGNPCTDDSCAPASGCANVANDATCDDGSLCTTGDHCAGGECVGAVTTCPADGDTLCAENQCNPATGLCELTYLNGKKCDDADPCTDSDVCASGACVGTPLACSDSDPCTADACDPATAECVHEPLATCEDLAWERANAYRELLDLPFIANHDAIIEASTKHCQCYVANASAYESMGLSPHSESASFEGYTGESFWDRLAAAGYDGSAMFEVMHFVNDPIEAVDDWVASLYHRIPFVVPLAKDMGYGAAQKGMKGCDTIDFGAYTTSQPQFKDLIIPFPPDGMSGVPTYWDGLESPQPPLPNPYPSGPIMTVTFGSATTSYAGVSIKDSDIHGPDGPVPHVANSPATDADLCCGVVALYANKPLQPFTTYTVTLDYSKNGKTGTFEWSFTTGAGGGITYLD